MNVIWRSYICNIRLRKVPFRCQSGNHPVAPLGSRILTDPAKVFEHNMWDHMQWSEEEAAAARKKVEENSAVRVEQEEQVKYENEASKYWDTFYKIHKNKFFKNRNWLLREFPEILPVDQKAKEKMGELPWHLAETNATNCFSRVPEEKEQYEKSSGSLDGQSKEESGGLNLNSKEQSKGLLKTDLFPGSGATFRILEVGCGAGNSVFPILNTLQNTPEFFLYCCDFAPGAVELIKVNQDKRAKQRSKAPLMQGAVNRLSKLLKPGGMLLFRDHGRYDMTQLRFKKGHCLSENFYVRGDGTRAYFFTKGEVHHMFCKAGLDVKQNLVDHRLQVNRKKQVKMHRVWVQGKFQKPLH
ncbi:methyltransferase-like protein 8 isoform X2 [Octodon degus]|uniref:tRNA N(3)-cytidine methyltransferase n=1 Tax=Octodon degus TaxID=10160 RepID=A0A6P6ESF3_OCTDE|nr:methyltransferase-like protein 8 isoform X2 [Octodon degus]